MRKGSFGLSNSEMSSFRRCKRMWYLSQYRGLRKKTGDVTGSASSIGNLVHDALAAYYDPDDPVDPVGYAEAALEVALAEHPSEEDELRTEFDLVRIMLTGYLEWLAMEGADADLHILGSEQTVRVVLNRGNEPVVLVNGETLQLISKLDAPVEHIPTGHRLMLEHKTTDSLNAPTEGSRINTQYLTEHLARFLHTIDQGASAEEAFEECRGVLVNMLRKVKRTSRAKPPFYGREEIRHNVHELRSHWKHVVAIAQEIAAAEVALDSGRDHHEIVPPNPIPRDCAWRCDFFRVCAMADDDSDFEGVLGALYEVGDPLDRYSEAEEM